MISTEQRGTSSDSFRPEIEGTRATAALLIAIFHIWLGRVSGGVDVFFAVSGFLITSALLRQLERSGRIQFGVFWGRLARRLLPGALLVLCTVILASLIWMPESRWKETGQAIAAAATYSENWHLLRSSVDYLAQNEGVSPVQHFWALSVQGQFYLLWPLLLTVAARIAHRMRWALRSTIFGLLLAVFAASLSWSVVVTAHAQAHAYFDTFARVWEFSIGALLATILPWIRLNPAVRFIAGWIGLLAIVSCGFVFHVSSVFPGYAALWPTLAAAAIIAAGSSGRSLGADRLLGSPPMIWLGHLSYGLFLWHFPVLVFARTLTDPVPLTMTTRVSVLLLSLLLAWLSNRYVEDPIRYENRNTKVPSSDLALCAKCFAPLMIGLALWSGYYLQLRHTSIGTVREEDPDYPGATAMLPNFHYAGRRNVPVSPGPLSVNEDREYLTGESCDLPDSATVPGLCALGSISNWKATVAVVGGSHSSQWVPALQEIAVQQRWRLVVFNKNNCPFYFGESVGEKPVASCHAWNENVYRALLHLRPQLIFTTATRQDDRKESLPEGYVREWQRLGAAGLPVVAIRDNPDPGFDVSACVELHGAGAPQCSWPRAVSLSEPSPFQGLQSRFKNIHFLDLSRYFCDDRLCHPVVGNVLLYRHGNHLTATYVRSLRAILRRVIVDEMRLLEPETPKGHAQTDG